ncbi:unnamed protein product [Clonostachys solani]|uniref:Ribosome biogenesis protein SLX9 n=1 Tax=Clonostachys solani TaxID=160281 RepID=A0A9N9Z6N1_9HYPO|nr:unnamed protein product [Clonostachys solani]
MAPRPPPSDKKPSARALRMQRITGQVHPLAPMKTHREGTLTDDSFLSSKRDKRQIKHSSFVSRISEGSRVAKSKKRTRRPGNKLAADLDALADALPEIDPGAAANRGKVQHKSLRTRKGALKRKERIVKGEMERFGASMARLADLPADQVAQKQQQVDEKMDEAPVPAASTSNRWAALRGYISTTMEQNPAFLNK